MLFCISAEMYTDRNRWKIEEDVLNRKDNIEYPLQIYWTDLKANEILIY